jgi:hypothetical protein
MCRMRGRFQQYGALLFVAAVFFALCQVQVRASGAGLPEPFSLRGFRLGILLADFKIMAAPDQGVWPGARPLCSNDAEVRSNNALSGSYAVRLSEAEAKTGIVRCSFFYPSDGALAPAGIVIAEARSTVSFFFLADREGEMRLASIRATTHSRNYTSIKSALVRKYGRPVLLFQGYVHDDAGTKLVDETTKWSRAGSNIQIDQREEHEDVQLMSIRYIHEALAAEGLKRLQAVLGSPTDTL